MKDIADNKTVDAFGVPKRGRGRPPKADSMTAAERQKAYVDRKRASGMGFVTVSLPLDLIAALDEFIKFKDLNKDAVFEKLVRSQLLRKR